MKVKIVIEKVPQGVRLSITLDTAKRPVVIDLTPAEFEAFAAIARTAFRSESFKFEYQQ